MGKGYILALDQSTSGSKAMVVNKAGDIISRASKEHRQYYPNPGWVEHDPMEIYDNVRQILRQAVDNAEIQPEDIDVLSITNQRETVLIWDKTDGKPVYNAIVWQCRRTADICSQLKQKGMEQSVIEKTGLVLDPYFSATKVKWILDNVKGAMDKAREGQLLMGTIDCWLIWKLTKGKAHLTDYTNASRTMLFNIKTLVWDDDLLRMFDVPHCMLPGIKSSNEVFGYTEQEELFHVSLPISGVIGDSQGALFGQACFEPGMVKVTYGTGSSILMHIGEKYIEPRKGLVTSLAWGVDGRVEYALEGIVHCTGDALKWCKDNLGLFDDFSCVEDMISSLSSNEGVYLVPAFVGLGIPYWDSNARAAIIGMSRSAGKEHIVRAAVESAAYQIKDAVDLMSLESGITPKEIRVDGGPTRNRFLMQFQADLVGIPVVCTKAAELSAMGAVYLAGLGAGIWKDKEELKTLRQEAGSFKASMEKDMQSRYYAGWKSAVEAVLIK